MQFQQFIPCYTILHLYLIHRTLNHRNFRKQVYYPESKFIEYNKQQMFLDPHAFHPKLQLIF